MSKKPSYEELEKRVHELGKLDSDRKQCIEAMEGEQTFLSAVLDNVKEAIIICDDKGNLVRFNEAARQLHGIPEQAILPDQWADHYDLYQLDGKTPLPTTENPLYRALMDEKVVDAEIVVAPNHADSHIMVCNGQALHDSNGRKIGAVVAMHDITKRKNAEERNVQLLARIRTTLEATADGILVVDRNGKQLFFSKRFAKLWRIPKEVLESKDDNFVLQYVLNQLQNPEGFMAKVKELYADPAANSFDIIKFKDGRIFERYSRPHTLNDEIVGRVWSFRDVTEQKSAFAKLQQSERKYKKLVENLNDVIFLVDKNGIVNYVSDPIEKVLGYKPIDLIGCKFNELIHPHDSELITQRFADVLQGKLAPSEYRFLSKNDEYRWVRTSSLPYFKEGELIGVQGILTDITDRKLAEERLEEHTKTLKDILERAADGICVCHNISETPYVRFTHWNPRMTDITGYTMEEINKAGWYQSMYPDLKVQQKAIERMAGMRKGNDIKSEEWLITRKNKKQKALSISTSVIKEENGQTHVVAVMQDVDERRLYQNQLLTSRKEWEDIFQAIGQPTMILDPKHGIIKANKATLKLTELTENQLKGKKCFNLFHGKGQPPESCPMESLINKNALDTVEMEMETLGGTFLVSCTPIIDQDGSIEKIIHIATDITKSKELETNLRQAQKMETVGRLAGGVAHDFNNMLGVILGHTELAMLKADEDNDLLSDLHEIQKAANRSADITKQLLAFARKQTIAPKQLDLNDTVESMLNMLRRLIGEDIDLVWQPASNLWPVKMDPSQINLILVNLCINARDAISGVGKLTIETGKKSFDEEYCKEHAGFIPGDFVLLAASDNGCGMDKETLENLFEPFYTTKDLGKGTGLGLATVYGIVKQNNGFINVYSEPGQGSTFKIYLPRLVAEEDIDRAVPEKKAAVGGSETILLVEDEAPILRMTRMMLQRKGYTVLSAATPAEAMEKAKNHSGSIDMLMTDVVMPEMNGRDLAAKVSALHPDIRLLFMSGYTADVIAYQGILDKGAAFIQKPFSMADMTEKVREVLDMALDKNQG